MGCDHSLINLEFNELKSKTCIRPLILSVHSIAELLDSRDAITVDATVVCQEATAEELEAERAAAAVEARETPVGAAAAKKHAMPKRPFEKSRASLATSESYFTADDQGNSAAQASGVGSSGSTAGAPAASTSQHDAPPEEGAATMFARDASAQLSVLQGDGVDGLLPPPPSPPAADVSLPSAAEKKVAAPLPSTTAGAFYDGAVTSQKSDQSVKTGRIYKQREEIRKALLQSMIYGVPLHIELKDSAPDFANVYCSDSMVPADFFCT